MNVISAGIVTTASGPDAATVLLKFLTSPAAAAVDRHGTGRLVNATSRDTRTA